jgi:hypothetical protein
MSLSPAGRLGPYEIVSLLGKGGMGEVYLARDTRLGRDVAIKALPDAFAHDPERLARFEREARLLASLKHPNIAAIYGLEESDGQRHLVLEYVAGPTLAERLAAGPLPLDEALDVCTQIATGVEAAHESGVVHRDLKPANVKLTPAGEVKVLDFGLAKSGTASASDSGLNLSHSPTVGVQAATSAGVILGTAAYMSPEQARGRPVDRRTDIWSFGCVLYECLTGKPLHRGETVSDLIANILAREPSWTELPPQTPQRLRALLARCLRKDARERQRDIGDVRLELTEIRAHGADAPAAAAVAPARAARSTRLAWITAGVLAIVAAAAALMPRGATAPVTRMTVLAPNLEFRTILGDFAMAPDGHAIAFTQSDSAGAKHLFVRELDHAGARLIASTEDAAWPFWSPDSRDLGFFAGGRLLRVPAGGGAVRALCDAPLGRGAAWGDGQIVFAPSARGPLFAVDDEGGTPRAVTVLDTTRHDISHRFPSMAPDGRHFVFAVQTRGARGTAPACVASLSDPHARVLFEASTAPVFAGPDRLLFTRDRALLVQGIDTGSGKLTGRPTVLEEPLNADADIYQSPAISCSRTGTMVYIPADQRPRDLVWITADGHTLPTGLRTDATSGVSQLSPDRTRLALIGYEPSGFSLSVVDLAQRRITQIAPMGRGLFFPVWSADGTQLAGNHSDNTTDLVKIDPASGVDSVLFGGQSMWRVATAWTPARDAVLYSELTPERRYDIGYLAFSDGKLHPYLSTPANEGAAVVSHDGRWVAYQSDASGRDEVFVDGFPGHAGAQRVGATTNGLNGGPGIWWSPDDRELSFVGADGSSIYSVSVQTAPRLTFSPPRLMMKLPATAGYDYAPELGRAIALVPVGSQPAAFTVVQNWAKEPAAKR